MTYTFGPYALDPESLELTNAGELIEVEPQVFSLLVCLIENRDRVMSKDELIEEVWDGRIVSDGTLNTRINAARKAVGDDGKAQAVIKTFSKRGFRWVADVDGESKTTTEPDNLTVAADKPSIAVLPFENLSNDPEQEYFSDGLTEDIITALSRIRWLAVIARNTMYTYKGKAVDVHTVAEELNVRYVLEGSVRKAGDTVRVSAQLIDGHTQDHIWAERYDRDLKDVFEVQDDLTHNIVAALPVQVEVADLARTRQKTTAEMSAYDYVLRGVELYHRETKEANAGAVEYFSQAIEADTNYARAYGWKACTLAQGVFKGFTEITHVENQEVTIPLLEKAWELDKNDSEVCRILGAINIRKGKLEEAQKFLERGLELNPNDSRIISANAGLLTWLGRPEESLELLHEAERLDPSGVGGWLQRFGTAYFSNREYAKSAQWFERVPILSVHEYAFLAAAQAHLGAAEQAKEHAECIIDLDSEFTITTFVAALPYVEDEDREHLADGLRKAGVPEE
tara:strand:- start:6394 stop:7926 length:1533 start_codon:yes stop_codon:yes gene_type:complete